MSQTHKADDYNLAQPSRSGQAGFESFKNEKDGRYYFHFNDAKGIALLFSQAYRHEADRDKGISSVIKHASVDKHFEQQNTEGGYFFILFASNKQQIVRSRVFKTVAELEKQHLYFTQNLSLQAEIEERPLELQKADIPKSEPSRVADVKVLTNENAELKRKITALETELKKAPPSVSEETTLSEETLRQIFRIEIYKNASSERLHGQIVHPFSKETRAFNGLDMKTMAAFMTEKIKMGGAVAPQSAKDMSALPKPTQAVTPVSVLNLSNQSAVLQHNQPFALIIHPQPHERTDVEIGQPIAIDVRVFNLDNREKYKLLEKRDSLVFVKDLNKQDDGLRVEPLVLSTGSYRLSLHVHVLSGNNPLIDSEIAQWQGGVIVQVY